MARLTERLGEWLSRAEILARGAEGHRLDAVEAQSADRPWEARAHALALLEEVPASRVGLALWADAAESMFLDNEVCEALERLVALIPFRADAWLRLASARSRLGLDPGAALERAAETGEPTAASDQARLWLCDLDLVRGDAARAERWLDLLSLGGRQTPEAVLRRVECALDWGDGPRAKSLAKDLPKPATLDARGWLVRGRIQAENGEDPLRAFSRALLLDAHGAERTLAAYLGERSEHATALSRLVSSLGRESHPLWRAAFALAEGRKDDALHALGDGAKKDPTLLDRYVALAIRGSGPRCAPGRHRARRSRLRSDPRARTSPRRRAGRSSSRAARSGRWRVGRGPSPRNLHALVSDRPRRLFFAPRRDCALGSSPGRARPRTRCGERRAGSGATAPGGDRRRVQRREVDADQRPAWRKRRAGRCDPDDGDHQPPGMGPRSFRTHRAARRR